MPTYEYQCDACGHRFEKFQSITAAPIRKCPSCGMKQVRRLLGTGGGIIFKGSGFYITDYRDKSYTDKAKAESGAPSATTSDSKPADSKPAASTDAKPGAKPEPKKPAAKKPSKSE